jgi:hypothetical protein
VTNMLHPPSFLSRLSSSGWWRVRSVQREEQERDRTSNAPKSPLMHCDDLVSSRQDRKQRPSRPRQFDMAQG